MTPAGIEPATIRFVARRLNHCATAVPTDIHKKHKNALCGLNVEFFNTKCGDVSWMHYNLIA